MSFKFTFKWSQMVVHNCRSKGEHADFDLCQIIVNRGPIQVGQATTWAKVVHAGDTRLFDSAHDGPLEVGSVDVSQGDTVYVTCTAINLRSARGDGGNDAQLALNVSAGVASAVSGVLGISAAAATPVPPLAVALGIAGGIVGIVGGVLSLTALAIGDPDPNCDGVVLTKVFQYSYADLVSRTGAIGASFSEWHNQIGSGPSECGNPSNTDMTLTITQVAAPMTAISMKVAETTIGSQATSWTNVTLGAIGGCPMQDGTHSYRVHKHQKSFLFGAQSSGYENPSYAWTLNNHKISTGASSLVLILSVKHIGYSLSHGLIEVEVQQQITFQLHQQGSQLKVALPMDSGNLEFSVGVTASESPIALGSSEVKSSVAHGSVDVEGENVEWDKATQDALDACARVRARLDAYRTIDPRSLVRGPGPESVHTIGEVIGILKVVDPALASRTAKIIAARFGK